MTIRTFTFSVTPPPTYDWIPAANSIRTIGASYGGNTVYSVNPTVANNGLAALPDVSLMSNNSDVFRNYCGGVYVPTLGTHGSILVHGGGHAGRAYNEVYLYDVAQAQWKRMTNPVYPLYPRQAPNALHVFDSSDFGERGDCYASADFSTFYTGQPSASHTYAMGTYAPQGSFGNDPAGYYFLPATNAGAYQGYARRCYYLGLTGRQANGTGYWTMGVDLHPNPFSEGCTLFDSSRNRMVTMGNSITNKAFINNCATTVSSNVSLSPGFDANKGVSAYDSASDLYMVVKSVGSSVLQLIRPSDSTPWQTKTATISTNLLAANADYGGWEWVQSAGAWVFYPKAGGNIVTILRRPADAWNGTWTMQQVTLGGDAGLPATNQVQHYSRLRYVPTLDVFIWASDFSQHCQAFKITL